MCYIIDSDSTLLILRHFIYSPLLSWLVSAHNFTLFFVPPVGSLVSLSYHYLRSCSFSSGHISYYSKFFASMVNNNTTAFLCSNIISGQLFITCPTKRGVSNKNRDGALGSCVSHDLINLLSFMVIWLKPYNESRSLRLTSSSIAANHTDWPAIFFHLFNGPGFNLNATLYIKIDLNNLLCSIHTICQHG